MTHEVIWNTPGSVLHLKLSNIMSLEEFIEIDKQINARLQEYEGRNIALIVDASNARFSAYSIERIKTTQKYLHGRQIDKLVVVSNNKLNRLVMMLLFTLCRPILHFYDNFDQAQRFLNMSSS